MAFNLNQRFPPPPPYFRFQDPGAYQNTNPPIVNPNKTPFLSKCERKIQSGAKIWTHKIYSSDIEKHIPNCTSLSSKVPRFSYEATDDVVNIEELLCQCDQPNVCECESDTKSIPEVVCQGKIKRTLFIGPPPRSSHQGLSAPSKRDKGFEVLPDGTTKRIFTKPEKECPPFYNTDVKESTAFYRGCKWSCRTAKTTQSTLDTPGPADYILEHEPTEAELCAEKVRAHKRKTAKQLRFIEMVQRRNILENFPGPSDYSPQPVKGTELSYLGPKLNATSKLGISPGPADHWLKRDFSFPEPPLKLCKASLPSRAPFGTKSVRLKPRKDVGPSPASYNPVYKPCQFIRCIKAPFLVSTKRFQEDLSESEDDYDDLELIDGKDDKNNVSRSCPTWQFKSKSIRMKPLQKEPIKSTPFSRESVNRRRLLELQYSAPFHSSEARFRPWYNWVPVHGNVKTPGPGYYNPTKAECYPAVKRGPLSRAARFQFHPSPYPAPNEYKLSNGIETVLHTHNERLKKSIENQHKFHWSPPSSVKELDCDEKESLLMKKSIALLNTPDDTEKKIKPAKRSLSKSRVLRCFASLNT